MADATLAETVQKVLEALGVLMAGETVEAEDQSFVEARVTSSNEKLRDLGVCYWSDAAFPQSIVDDFARYVACQVAEPYLGQQAGGAFKAANETKSLMELRKLTASRERMEKPTRQDYF